MAAQRRTRVLCVRELQNSISESVHRLLSTQIDEMGLGPFFEIQRDGIYGKNGSEFIYMGIRNNPDKVKSTEGVDFGWVEEAQTISETSWEILDPTIRKPGSQIFVVYNPRYKHDHIHRLFAGDAPPPGTIYKRLNYQDNPFFPKVLIPQMEHMKRTNPLMYRHVWEGECVPALNTALWGWDSIQNNRLTPGTALEMARVVVAIDPAVTAKATSDETGIIAAGASKGKPRHYYILGDASGRYQPEAWAQRALGLYDRVEADAIVYEVNQGGDLVAATIRNACMAQNRPVPRLVPVRATRGKVVRAEPISALYADGLVHHVGNYPELEEQMMSFNPADPNSKSPDRCFVAGTRVLLRRGYTPIEQVRVGDEALTRQGWKRVLAVACTNPAATVKRYELSNGSIFEATPTHPMILADGRVVALDSLVCEDYLVGEEAVWLAAKKSGSMETNLCVTPTVRESTCSGTFGRLAGAVLRLVRSTEKFGIFTTDQFRRAWWSTTKTVISATTPLKILSCALTQITQKNTKNFIPTSSSSAALLTWSAFDTQQKSGTVRKKAVSGTRKMPSEFGSDRHTEQKLVNNAENHTKPAPHALPSIAIGDAPQPPFTQLIATMKLQLASFAKKSFGATSTASASRKRALVSVERSFVVSEPKAVYNLTVEDAHEYVVEGVLAHNCDALVWGLTDLTAMRAPMQFAQNALARFGART